MFKKIFSLVAVSLLSCSPEQQVQTIEPINYPQDSCPCVGQVGPTGPQGPVGPQGVKGEAGERGPAGPAGHPDEYGIGATTNGCEAVKNFSSQALDSQLANCRQLGSGFLPERKTCFAVNIPVDASYSYTLTGAYRVLYATASSAFQDRVGPSVSVDGVKVAAGFGEGDLFLEAGDHRVCVVLERFAVDGAAGYRREAFAKLLLKKDVSYYNFQ